MLSLGFGYACDLSGLTALWQLQLRLEHYHTPNTPNHPSELKEHEQAEEKQAQPNPWQRKREGESPRESGEEGCHCASWAHATLIMPPETSLVQREERKGGTGEGEGETRGGAGMSVRPSC